MMKKFLPPALAALALLAPDSTAAVVTIPVTADTTLHQNFPNNNLGKNGILAVGTSDRDLGGGEFAKARALLFFDLAAQVPPGMTVTRARVFITVIGGPGSPSSPFALSKMLAPWTEGAGGAVDDVDGRPALTGETTWNHRVAATTPWQTAGARGANDVAATASATVNIANTEEYIFESPALAADVQSWLANPAGNFGWALWGVDQTTRRIAWQIAARELEVAIPQLEITYSETVEDLRITNIRIENGQAQLTWIGGRAPYRIERRSEITATPQILPDQIVGTSASVPLSGARSFYRIVGSN